MPSFKFAFLLVILPMLTHFYTPIPNHQSIMDEMRKQVLADIDQLRKAAELILPKPVIIALGQVFTAVAKVAHAMQKTFTQSVVPKLKTCVLNEGISDGLPLPWMLKAYFIGSLITLITRVIISRFLFVGSRFTRSRIGQETANSCWQKFQVRCLLIFCLCLKIQNEKTILPCAFPYYNYLFHARAFRVKIGELGIFGEATNN